MNKILKIIDKRIEHLSLNKEPYCNIRIAELKILKLIIRDKWKS